MGQGAGFSLISSASHRAHVSRGYTYNCNTCHTGAGDQTAVHADGLIQVSIPTGGTYSQAGQAAGNGYGTCSTTACHSTFGGTPAWGGTLTGAAACQGCHGNEVDAATRLSGAHADHMTGTSGGVFKCKDCHVTVITNADNRTIADKALHANAIVNYSGVMAGKNKTCANIYCHSNGKGTPANPPVWTSATDLSCNGCHGTGNGFGRPDYASGAAGSATANSHAAHAASASDCYKCHRLTASTTAGALVAGNVDHLDKTLDARFSKMALTNYSGRYNSGKTCSATYCHGGGVTTVAWGTTGPLACNVCHLSSSLLPGAHNLHVNTTVATSYATAAANTSITTVTNFTCASCHGNTATNHANAPVANGSDATIFFGFSSAGKNPTYARTGTSTADSQGFYWMAGTAGACNATYCHSNGQGGNGALGTITWASTATAACNSCHGNETNAATLSGAHNDHVAFAATGGNFKCSACHAQVITNADNRTLADKSKHVNKMINYSGAFAGKNKTCANIYCHSNGKGTFANPPAWGSATDLTCQSCHAEAGLSGGAYGHSGHIAKTATCKYCHSTTTTNDTSITGAAHIDGTVNLISGGFYPAVPGTKTVSFSPSGSTCNNVSCHSPAATGPYSNTATWGVKANCDTCHPKAGLSGHHTIHIGALNLTDSSILYNMTANRTLVQTDAVLTHGFGCANCHPLNLGEHLDGNIDVDMSSKGVAGTSSIRFLNSTTAGKLPSYSAGTCANIYCHSNASRVTAELVYKPTPAWVGGSFTGDRCAACHDNQPATGAHAAHVVGTHTLNENPGMLAGNIYNGKSGKVGISNRANTAHGNPNNSTTIGCYICHQATVTSKANDKNTKCVVCHYSGNPYGATLKGNASINNLKSHVNGSREIQFVATKVMSKAQVRPESFKFYSGVWKRTTYKNMSTLSYDTAKVALDTATMWHASTPQDSNCSNIACHNGKLVKWNLANFSDPNKCMDCHNQL
jgi:predicted CxxxxCH...CXXCH cytochrome family protein